MTNYYLKPEYHQCTKDDDLQPRGMALSNIDVAKPIHIVGKSIWSDSTEVRYTAINGSRPWGYVEMKFLTLYRNGKRGKPLRQRKVGKRK